MKPIPNLTIPDGVDLHAYLDGWVDCYHVFKDSPPSKGVLIEVQDISGFPHSLIMGYEFTPAYPFSVETLSLLLRNDHSAIGKVTHRIRSRLEHEPVKIKLNNEVRPYNQINIWQSDSSRKLNQWIMLTFYNQS